MAYSKIANKTLACIFLLLRISHIVFVARSRAFAAAQKLLCYNAVISGVRKAVNDQHGHQKRGGQYA